MACTLAGCRLSTHRPTVERSAKGGRSENQCGFFVPVCLNWGRRSQRPVVLAVPLVYYWVCVRLSFKLLSFCLGLLICRSQSCLTRSVLDKLLFVSCFLVLPTLDLWHPFPPPPVLLNGLLCHSASSFQSWLGNDSWLSRSFLCSPSVYVCGGGGNGHTWIIPFWLERTSYVLCVLQDTSAGFSLLSITFWERHGRGLSKQDCVREPRALHLCFS